MKSVFIISSYPSSQKKIDVLKECLKSIKNTGFDILLTTNYPINDKEVFELVDYLIWDKTDIQSIIDYDIFLNEGWYMLGDGFRATTSFDNAYHFDLYRSLYNGVNFVKELGYDFFYYLEGDCVLLDGGFLSDKRDEMFSNNKKMMFVDMKITNDDRGHYMAYMTHIFGGEPVSFLKSTVNIPHNIEGWVSNHNFYTNGMEVIFYNEIKDKDNILNLKYEDFIGKIEFNRIKKNEINGFKSMFFFNGEDMYLIIYNGGDDISKIEFKIDDDPWLNMDLGKRGYYTLKINENDLLNKNIKETVTTNNDVMIFEKYLDSKTLKRLKQSQKVIFN